MNCMDTSREVVWRLEQKINRPLGGNIPFVLKNHHATIRRPLNGEPNESYVRDVVEPAVEYLSSKMAGACMTLPPTILKNIENHISVTPSGHTLRVSSIDEHAPFRIDIFVAHASQRTSAT